MLMPVPLSPPFLFRAAAVSVSDLKDWKEAYLIQKLFVDRTEQTKRKFLGLGVEVTKRENAELRDALMSPKLFIVPVLFMTLLMKRKYSLRVATVLAAGGFLTIHTYGIQFYANGYERVLDDRTVYHKVIYEKTADTLQPCYDDPRLQRHMFAATKNIYEKVLRDRKWAEEHEALRFFPGEEGAEQEQEEEFADERARLEARERKKSADPLYNYMDDILDEG